MIAKENPTTPREKAGGANARAIERAGENAKAASAAAAGAGVVAPDGRASSADGARPSYVPTRRRSRRNLLL